MDRRTDRWTQSDSNSSAGFTSRAKNNNVIVYMEYYRSFLYKLWLVAYIFCAVLTLSVAFCTLILEDVCSSKSSRCSISMSSCCCLYSLWNTWNSINDVHSWISHFQVLLIIHANFKSSRQRGFKLYTYGLEDLNHVS